MGQVKDGTYFNVQAFMVNELDLKGNELMVYAIIFGFCQKEEGCYIGGPEYIANWLQVSSRQARRVIKGLEDRGIVYSRVIVINSHCRNSYYCTPLSKVKSKCNSSKNLNLNKSAQIKKTAGHRGQVDKCVRGDVDKVPDSTKQQVTGVKWTNASAGKSQILQNQQKSRSQGSSGQMRPRAKGEGPVDILGQPGGHIRPRPVDILGQPGGHIRPVAYNSNNKINNKRKNKINTLSLDNKDNHTCRQEKERIKNFNLAELGIVGYGSEFQIDLSTLKPNELSTKDFGIDKKYLISVINNLCFGGSQKIINGINSWVSRDGRLILYQAVKDTKPVKRDYDDLSWLNPKPDPDFSLRPKHVPVDCLPDSMLTDNEIVLRYSDIEQRKKRLKNYKTSKVCGIDVVEF